MGGKRYQHCYYIITCVLTGIFFFPACYYANCERVVMALSAFPYISSWSFVKLITLNFDSLEYSRIVEQSHLHQDETRFPGKHS